MFDYLNMQTAQEDIDALQMLVRQLTKDRTNVSCIEVGSWTGRTALAMAEAWPHVLVYCVDTWHGSPNDQTGQWAKEFSPTMVFRTFCTNLRGLLLTRVIPCVGTSKFWASVWPFKVDLVFIDGDHTYETCLADIQAWTPHVKPGGVLCGHDIGPQFPGVERAVRETGPFAVVGKAVWWRQITA